MRSPGSVTGLLRWYPAAWRERYGDELVALMEDHLDGRPATVGFRASVARAGLRERAHQAKLAADGQPAGRRLLTGSLVVLVAWTALVVAGASLAKISEHTTQVVPGGLGSLSGASYGAVVGAALVGGSLVLAGLLLAVPAAVRFLSSGGWPAVRGHVLRSGGATIAAVAAVGGLAGLASTLTPGQRNGLLIPHPVVGYYLVAFVATGVVVTVMLGCWAGAAVAVARRLDLSRGVLRAEAGLALGVTAAMVVTTGAAALWWAATASSAPWFLAGVRPGNPAPPVTGPLLLTMTLMTAATALAGYGSVRIARAGRPTGPA